MYRLKLRMRFVLSDKTAKQKTWFLLCSAALRRRAGLVLPAAGSTAGREFAEEVRAVSEYLQNSSANSTSYKLYAHRINCLS
jgi:hypothetical protein